jgi:hypothetical protein
MISSSEYILFKKLMDLHKIAQKLTVSKREYKAFLKDYKSARHSIKAFKELAEEEQ